MRIMLSVGLCGAWTLAACGSGDAESFAGDPPPLEDVIQADSAPADDGGPGSRGGAEGSGGDPGLQGEEGGAADEDRGAGPPPEGCGEAADCGDGYLCIAGRCVFQGDAPTPRDVCRGLSDERPMADPPPATGDRFMFLALPSTPSLARIEIATLAVDEVPLGGEALAVATLPGRDVAVALLAQGRASVISAEEDGEPVVTEVEVRQGLTHLTTSNATPHVVAWADHDAKEGGAKNPSEVSVVDLSEVVDLVRVDPPVHHLSVGTRPRSVAFDDAGQRLLVVTDDGVSLTEVGTLEGDQILPPIPVHDDPVGSDPEARTVLLTSDGAYAVVVQPGESVLRLVDLESGGVEPVALPLDAAPTDVAFVPSADPALAGRRVVAVVGDAGQAVILDVPGDWQEGGAPEIVEIDTPVCQVSVSPTGDEAALFSSVGDVPALVRLRLGEGVVPDDRTQVERLVATILGVAWSANGASAVAFHPRDPESPLFSMMTFADGFFAKSFAPSGARGRFLFSPPEAASESRLLLTVTNPEDNRHELLSIPTSSFIPTSVRLRAPPKDLGVITQTNQAYVTQDAPEGLISFITLTEAHETREVSRFRRNRRID